MLRPKGQNINYKNSPWAVSLVNIDRQSDNEDEGQYDSS